MRVTYNREMKIKRLFDDMGVSSYIPMHYAFTGEGANRKRELVPAIHNLIFVQSTQDTLTGLKMRDKEFDCLRYIIRRGFNGTRGEIIHVPDSQMENFIKATSVADDHLRYLNYCDDSLEKGIKVMVTNGVFAGVTGVVKRIKKNKCVVICIEDVAAVAIAYVPKEQLEVMV